MMNAGAAANDDYGSVWASMMMAGAAINADGGCGRQLRFPFFTKRQIKEREERGKSEVEKENTMGE